MKSIDAVISWVDGHAPAFQQKLNAYCLQHGIDRAHAVEPTRIHQANEIHYCLHALRRFAPWIRTIYIITNQQIPPTVTALQGTPFGKKIKIIDQNDLLRDAGITTPVFNSLSIEWLMWNISGLSDQFLYLNDDFFIIRPVTPDDFFRNNQLVLRGEWKVQADKKWFYQITQRVLGWMGCPQKKPKTNPHRSWQEKSAQLAGWHRQFYLLPHAPFALIKKTFENYLAQNPELCIKNSQYPFRHADQISCVPLMVHLDLKQERVIYDAKNQAVMVNGEVHPLKKIKARLDRAIKNKSVSFVCMQSIDQAPPATQRYMMHWLEEHICGTTV